MGGSAATTFRKVLTLVLAACVDLSLFYASGCVLAHSVFGHLARLWVSALLRCIALTAVTLLSLGDLEACLIRFITAHSLLPAVFVTGSNAARCGFVADTRCWLLRCFGNSPSRTEAMATTTTTTATTTRLRRRNPESCLCGSY